MRVTTHFIRAHKLILFFVFSWLIFLFSGLSAKSNTPVVFFSVAFLWFRFCKRAHVLTT
jgi:hypothetical protein